MKPAPRVLINARLYGFGGREMHLVRLGHILNEAGMDVHLATRFAAAASPLSELAQSGVRQLSTPFASSLSSFRISTLWALAFWRFRHPPRSFDVIYSLEASPFLVWLRRFLKPGGSVIWNPVGPLSEHPQELPTSTRAAIDMMIVESEWHRSRVRRCFHFDGPVRVAPHLCTDIRSPLPARVVEDGEMRVGYLGRLDAAKGIIRLLEVWPTLNIGNARLVYVGDGPKREELLNLIQKRGLDKQVEVRRTQWRSESELRAIVKAIDLAVLPSESEGLPLLLLEILGLGIPFVAFDVGAIRLIAPGNPDVQVVPLGNESLRQGIEQVVGRIRRREVNHGELRRRFVATFSPVTLKDTWRECFVPRQTRSD